MIKAILYNAVLPLVVGTAGIVLVVSIAYIIALAVTGN